MKTLARPFALIFGILALIVLASGCGMDHSPTAVSDEVAEPAAKRPWMRNTCTMSASTAVDLSADEARSVSQWVKPRNKAQLIIRDLNGLYSGDDLHVHFVVPNRAVNKRVQITMTVYGNYLSDLVIAFQPGGLVFNQDAELQVVMGPTLVDIDTETLQIWHEYEDGTVEKTTVTATKTYQNGNFEFKVAVPGFSRYGLRGS